MKLAATGQIPYLSIVVAARNDDHGGNMRQRFQTFLDHLDDMANRHPLPMELIVVEWNPDPGRPPLAKVMQWPGTPCLSTRIITVPQELHNRYENHERISFFQMIAKNVGIRRAKGKFVLATTADVLFSEELAAFLAQQRLDPKSFYRIDRYDISKRTIPTNLDWRGRLLFCERNIVRVNGQHGTYSWGAVQPTGNTAKPHTNAAGDFTLLSREEWFHLKGYPEFPVWSIYIEGLLIYSAIASGMQQCILADPCRLYHIEHKGCWSTERPSGNSLPALDYRKQYIPLCDSILAAKKKLNVNNPNWGLFGMQLQETEPSPSKRRENSVAANINVLPPTAPFQLWIDTLAAIDDRLYYRDQSAATLQSLAQLAQELNPTVIIELGTLSGLSLRTWLASTQGARIHAVDRSFQKLQETCEFFPIDFSRVELHEQDILSLDFRRLWNEQDRVILFVDAHDAPNIPIMTHVLQNALPHLPKRNVVIVDDIWHSSERLTAQTAQHFLDDILVPEIDELLCFDGCYGPYHAGGSFMGFPEVAPLLKFVNGRRIKLHYMGKRKHIWFTYDSSAREAQNTGDIPHDNGSWGNITYNPLDIESQQPLTRRVLDAAAKLYRQGAVVRTSALLSDFLEKNTTAEGYYGLAVCCARNGQLLDAYKLLKGSCRFDTSSTKMEKRRVRILQGLEKHLGIKDRKRTGQNGLTIFAMPKPFTGHTAIIQKNAIRSWARLIPRPEIILFGDESGVAEMAQEVGARHVAEVARNEFGTPLVNDLFHRAVQLAANDTLAYINADIILLENFMEGVERARSIGKNFLLIGRRWDLDVLKEIDFSNSAWRKAMREEVIRNGFLHAAVGIDYFVHSRGLWLGMPPFAIGRCAWDNWLLEEAGIQKNTVIDASNYIKIIHQEHNYAHVVNKHTAFNGLEARRNRAFMRFVQGHGNGSTSEAQFFFTKEGKIKERDLASRRYVPEDQSEKLRWLFCTANALMLQHHPDLALSKYENILEIVPGNHDALARRDTARHEIIAMSHNV